MKTLDIFISSPGDVIEERALANRAIERLQSEYAGRIVLQPVLWEHEPLLATANFQEQIVQPSDTEVFIAILWSRLGTRLPKGYERADGSRYDSGTEYEFEEAIEGFRKNGKPEMLVYRKTAPPSVRLDDEEELLARLRQKKKLDVFVDKWFHDKAEGTLVAAFHAFESPGDFEHLLETHLRKLVERQLPKSVMSVAEAPAVWKKGSPFRGLHAFDYEHAPVFFGRTKAVSDILQALREQADDDRPFVLILGMSGGGKSSVVRAGVLPMLTRPGVMEGIGLWRRAVFRPADVPGDLFTGLATALLGEHALPSLDTDGSGPAELAQVLQDSPQAAVSLIKTALAQEAASAGGDTTARLALVIDQMEEMFTQEDIRPKHRKAFVDVLDALARSGHIWILCTLRSDFYPRLADLPKLGALKEGAGQYDLMPPNASEIGQIIRLPTRAAALHFEEDPASSERLDDMLRDAAAEHPEVLPLLQFTLEELYQRRTGEGMLTLEAYRDLGGVEGSLAQRAETVFKDLPDDVQDELPKVLRELVSIEQDGHETIGRKRAAWSDVTTGKSAELVETFIENRLFVTELDRDGSAVVTVAHEALLWHWPRVREWVDQNRENLRIRSRITAAAERWAINNKTTDLLLPAGKPLVEAESLLEQDFELHEIEANFVNASIARAKRYQRLRAGVVATLAILGLVAAWSSFVANQQRDLADQSRVQAEIEAETAKQTTEFMVNLFGVSDPSEARGNSITAREIMDKGANRINEELTDQPAIQATLMETIGTVYTSLGLYDQAASLLDSALKKRQELYGDEHLEVARSHDRLGEVLTLKAEHATAAEMFRKALAVRRNLLGEEHPDVAESMAGLANVLSLQGEFATAEPLFRDALDIRRNALGVQHADIAQNLEDLGLNLFDQGDYDAPLPLLRESLAMRRALVGDAPDPDVAEVTNNLAVVLVERGEYYEAEALYRSALDMKRRLYGEAHPEIATGLNNIAQVLYYNGDYKGAETMFREVVDMQRQLLGDIHPNVALALNNLAFILSVLGDKSSAITMSQLSLDIYREVFGDSHPLVARGLDVLARWFADEDNYETAEPMIHEALAMRKELLGNNHPDVAKSQMQLAKLLIATGRYEDALDNSIQARQICATALSPEHWHTAVATSLIGASLAGLGKYEEAELPLVQSYTSIIDIKGQNDPNTVDALQRVISLYEAWGRAENAAEYRRQLTGS